MSEVALVKQEDGSYKLDLSAAKPIETAEMEAGGALAGITSIAPWDIPIGRAAVGGVGAVVGSELIDGFLVAQSTQVKGLVKLIVAGASAKWGKKLMGADAATAIALLLAYDGVRMVLPLDEFANKIAGMFTKLTGHGLGGRAGMGNGEVLNQAGEVAANYYSSLSRRAG